MKSQFNSGLCSFIHAVFQSVQTCRELRRVEFKITPCQERTSVIQVLQAGPFSKGNCFFYIIFIERINDIGLRRFGRPFHPDTVQFRMRQTFR